MYSCLSGGLGNQMFQYSAAYILKQFFPDDTLVLDDSYYFNQPKNDTKRCLELDQFNVSYDRVSSETEKGKINILRKLKKIPLPTNLLYFSSSVFLDKYVLPDALFYHPQSIKNIDKACLFSFYQNSELLDNNRELILPLFELRADLLEYCTNLEVYSLIQKQGNITSLHIRRGDYVTNKHAAKFHGVLSLDYYNDAMNYVDNQLGEQLFVIFSDDIEWAQKAFSTRKNCYVVNNQGYDFSAIDMYLMSLCKNNIIANSTYSWWGAWLNKYEDKLVISPKQWFQGNNETALKKDSWITI